MPNTQLTNLRISDQKLNRRVATAPIGSLDEEQGHSSQLLIFDVKNDPGQTLVKDRLYTVVADQMSPKMNMQYDHRQIDNGPWVFYGAG